MQVFKLDFTFNHAHRTASVSVLQGTDHLQYTIVPDDPVLEEEFGTQVVHRFGDKFEFAFPGEGKEAGEYNEALEKAFKKKFNQAI